MELGRRSQYRVKVDGNAALDVMIRQDGREIAGRLADLSGSGAGVYFEGPDYPNLTVGQEADLVFASEKLDTPLVVAARIQHRTEEHSSRRYGFRFLQPQQLETLLPADFRHYFNRRRVERIAPDPYRPVAVTMACDRAPETDVRLVNISPLGAAVSLDAPLEPAFADTTSVILRLELPDIKKPVVMVADVRYRRLVGDRVYYGIEFNADATQGFEKGQEAIARYTSRIGDNLKKSA